MRWSAKKLKNFILKEVRLLEKHAHGHDPMKSMGMRGVSDHDDYYDDEDLGMMDVHIHRHHDEEEMHPYDIADQMHDEDHSHDMPHGAMPDYHNPMDHMHDDHMGAEHDDYDDYHDHGLEMGGEDMDMGPASGFTPGSYEDDYPGVKDLHLYEADEDEDEGDLKEVDELEEEDEVDEGGCGSSRGGMYEEDEMEEGDEDEGEKLEEGLRRWQKLAGLLRG